MRNSGAQQPESASNQRQTRDKLILRQCILKDAPVVTQGDVEEVA
jgi:hypothetical protein